LYFDTRRRNREKGCERAPEIRFSDRTPADRKIFLAARSAAIGWAAVGNLIGACILYMYLQDLGASAGDREQRNEREGS